MGPGCVHCAREETQMPDVTATGERDCISLFAALHFACCNLAILVSLQIVDEMRSLTLHFALLHVAELHFAV